MSEISTFEPDTFAVDTFRGPQHRPADMLHVNVTRNGESVTSTRWPQPASLATWAAVITHTLASLDAPPRTIHVVPRPEILDALDVDDLDITDPRVADLAIGDVLQVWASGQTREPTYAGHDW